MIADCVQCSEEKEILQVFKAYDTDHSGTVEHDELKQVLKLLYGPVAPSHDDIIDIIAMVDLNGDGQVNYTELVQVQHHIIGVMARETTGSGCFLKLYNILLLAYFHLINTWFCIRQIHEFADDLTIHHLNYYSLVTT